MPKKNNTPAKPALAPEEALFQAVSLCRKAGALTMGFDAVEDRPEDTGGCGHHKYSLPFPGRKTDTSAGYCRWRDPYGRPAPPGYQLPHSPGAPPSKAPAPYPSHPSPVYGSQIRCPAGSDILPEPFYPPCPDRRPPHSEKYAAGAEPPAPHLPQLHSHTSAVRENLSQTQYQSFRLSQSNNASSSSSLFKFLKNI